MKRSASWTIKRTIGKTYTLSLKPNNRITSYLFYYLYRFENRLNAEYYGNGPKTYLNVKYGDALRKRHRYMRDYRILGDDGHLHYMGILLQRSQIQFNANWLAAEEERYLFEEEENNIAREEEDDDNNIPNIENNAPAMAINTDEEWDDNWAIHPSENQQSTRVVSTIINFINSIFSYFNILKK